MDPAANLQNPKARLNQQKSIFADLLKFNGSKNDNLRSRVGANAYNPILDEIEERLKNPMGR